jgi:hypothetical protein
MQAGFTHDQCRSAQEFVTYTFMGYGATLRDTGLGRGSLKQNRLKMVRGEPCDDPDRFWSSR